MESNNREQNNKKKCANAKCGLEIHTGDEALVLRRVVMGLLRPIPLEESPLFFNDNECLKKFLCDSEMEKLHRKIPTKIVKDRGVRQTSLEEFI